MTRPDEEAILEDEHTATMTTLRDRSDAAVQRAWCLLHMPAYPDNFVASPPRPVAADLEG